MARGEYLVRHVGSALLGIPLAAVASLCSKVLWPVTALPVFFLVFVAWIASGISMILREAREGIPEGWMSFTRASSKTRFWPGAFARTSESRWLEYILNNMASSIFGLVLAIMIAGTVRRLLGAGEWYALFVVLAVWMLGTMKMIATDYRSRSGGADGVKSKGRVAQSESRKGEKKGV